METIPNFLEVTPRRPGAALIRHGKEFWQQAVRDHQISGLSPSEFFRQHGLAKATFFKWRKVLKEQAQIELPTSRPETQSMPGFLAVPLGQTPCSPANHAHQISARSEVEHHGGDAKISIKLSGVDVLLSGHYADRVMRILTERLSSGGLR